MILAAHSPISAVETKELREVPKGLEELYEGNLWKKGVDAMKDAAKAKA